jgi:hypothetical protein
MKHMNGCQTKKNPLKNPSLHSTEVSSRYSKHDKKRSGVDLCNTMTISHKVEVEQKGTRVLVAQAYPQACPQS